MKTRCQFIVLAYACALSLLPLATSCQCQAADWPQWRGPDRNEVSKETGLLKRWLSSGPPLLWTNANAGIGYSGPAIVGDRLFTMGARGGTEYVYALDVKRGGRQVWATPIGPLFQNGYGSGPRGTPTVDGGLLYALGGQGELICVEAGTGKKRWHRNLLRQLGGEMMSGWGYAESPLVDGDQVICSPGGSEGTLAALDKRTGEVRWRSKDLTDPAAYSSCIVAEVGSIRQYIQVTGKGVAGVAAPDGRLLWHYVQPEGKYRTAVVPTPIFHDGLAYVTADYGAGCDLLRLTPDGQGTKAELVYANKNMQNHHGGVVLVDGYLYGCSGNVNQRTKWVCQELKTGKIVWEEERKLDAGSLTYADGHLYCYGQKDGTVVLIEATPKGWKESGRFKIPRQTSQRSPKGKIWTHPVVANGRLYLRDQELLFCFDVKAR